MEEKECFKWCVRCVQEEGMERLLRLVDAFSEHSENGDGGDVVAELTALANWQRNAHWMMGITIHYNFIVANGNVPPMYLQPIMWLWFHRSAFWTFQSHKRDFSAMSSAS